MTLPTVTIREGDFAARCDREHVLNIPRRFAVGQRPSAISRSASIETHCSRVATALPVGGTFSGGRLMVDGASSNMITPTPPSTPFRRS